MTDITRSFGLLSHDLAVTVQVPLPGGPRVGGRAGGSTPASARAGRGWARARRGPAAGGRAGSAPAGGRSRPAPHLGEAGGPGRRAEAARDLHLQLGHAQGPLRQIVGEGHGRVGHEQQAGVPQVPQGQGQVVAAAAPAGRRRQLLVVRQTGSRSASQASFVAARTASGTGPPVSSNQCAATSRAPSSSRCMRAAQLSAVGSRSTISSRLRSRWRCRRHEGSRPAASSRTPGGRARPCRRGTPSRRRRGPPGGRTCAPRRRSRAARPAPPPPAARSRPCRPPAAPGPAAPTARRGPPAVRPPVGRGPRPRPWTTAPRARPAAGRAAAPPAGAAHTAGRPPAPPGAGPNCTGPSTPAGKGARVRVPQPGQPTACARCSITNRGGGSGRSCTWRTAGAPAAIRGRRRRSPRTASASGPRGRRSAPPACGSAPHGPAGPRLAPLRPALAARARRRRRPVLRGRLAAVAAVPPQLPPQIGVLLPQGGQLGGQTVHRRHQTGHDRMAGQDGIGGHKGQLLGEGRGGHRPSVAHTAPGMPNPTRPRAVRQTEPGVPEQLHLATVESS